MRKAGKGMSEIPGVLQAARRVPGSAAKVRSKH